MGGSASGGRRRPRRLTEADRAAWEHVARSAVPLTARAPDPPPLPSTAVPVAPPAVAPAPVRFGQSDTAQPPAPARTLRPQGRPAPQVSLRLAGSGLDRLDPAPGLDGATARSLRRGRREPEARLDLHGMTAERAHGALARFLHDHRRAGARCVLVITGKGGRRAPEDAPWLPEGAGVLRNAVPRWLRTAPLSDLVIGVYAAHLRHGGEGALYVYLRKHRSG